MSDIGKEKLEQLQRLWVVVKNLFEKDFYGELVIKFEAGKVVIIEEKRKHKL